MRGTIMEILEIGMAIVVVALCGLFLIGCSPVPEADTRKMVQEMTAGKGQIMEILPIPDSNGYVVYVVRIGGTFHLYLMQRGALSPYFVSRTQIRSLLCPEHPRAPGEQKE